MWLDLIKAFALVWIFTNHIAEQLFGYPLIANPTADWPPLAERIAQLAPLKGYGPWSLPLNALRYVGWFGDQGVQLFLIASGFGLTWGLLQKSPNGPLSPGKFYLRRAERVYPLWIGVHLFFGITWLVIGWGIPATDLSFYLSMLGVRFTPGLFYYFSPAWWYIGLLIQLYLVYPLLWQGLRRLGAGRLLVISGAIAFVIRGIGLYLFEGYLDAWLRGAIFITRLPEFVFGISLAAWFFDAPEQTARRLRDPRTVVLALLVYAAGIALALTLPGMILAPFLLGAGAFVVLYAVMAVASQHLSERVLQPAVWIGQHSYSLYLVHDPWILLFVPPGLQRLLRSMAGGIAAAVFTLASGVALEWAVDSFQRWLGRQVKGRGVLRAAAYLAVMVGVVAALLIASELAVQRFAPQEVMGWGERPSLITDDTLGWRLIPNQATRLRWESYDYEVRANELGFPGTSYPEQKAPGTLRILVTGDAFTSAEGVDTDRAWPRLLETGLAQEMSQPVEVSNFAITGYGPNQYAAVVEKYAPLYQPDLILVEVFVNDFQDVLFSNADFQQSIGFGLPSQDGLYTTLRLEHLRRLMRLQVIEPLSEWIRGKPRPQGYFLGNFLALERGHPEFEETGREKMAGQLSWMKAVADGLGANLVVVMAPASVQVCQPAQLAYYPRNVDLADAARYDLDLPQRMMSEITQAAGVPFYDLRPVLQAAPGGCPYQAHNMHWTGAGHQLVADYLAGVLRDTLQNRSGSRN